MELFEESAKIFGPIGALVIFLLARLWKQSRNGPSSEERAEANRAIIRIEANVEHLIDDVQEVKGDCKSTQSSLIEHLQHHSR